MSTEFDTDAELQAFDSARDEFFNQPTLHRTPYEQQLGLWVAAREFFAPDESSEETSIPLTDAMFRNEALRLAHDSTIGPEDVTKRAEAYLTFLTDTGPGVDVEGTHFTAEQWDAIQDYIEGQVHRKLRDRGGNGHTSVVA